MLVEVCANSLESALIAERAGADRLELCVALELGGLTPSYGLLQAVKKQVSIPVRVLIRPRAGDFTYSHQEFEIMKQNIAHCAELHFDGVVAGVLQKDLTLDEGRLISLLSVAGPLAFTFHRAFDWVPDPLGTFDRLGALGVDTVLTSGQARTAEEGMPLLKTLESRSGSCTVMPGCGIRSSNAGLFKQNGFEALHLSGAAIVDTLAEVPQVPMRSDATLSDGQLLRTDGDIIRKVVASVK